MLAFARFSCRAIFFRSMWSIFIFALLTGLLSFLFYPIVIEQSGNFYTTLLSDSKLVSNIAVLISFEAIIGILLSVGLLSTLFKKGKKTKFYYLKYLPELLIAGAVLYAEQQMFYALPGYDFRFTASLTAVVFASVIGCISYIMHRALPEISSRYELNFLINMLLLIVAVMLNAGLTHYSTGNYHIEIAWKNTAVFLGLIVLLVITGFILHQIKLRNKKYK